MDTFHSFPTLFIFYFNQEIEKDSKNSQGLLQRERKKETTRGQFLTPIPPSPFSLHKGQPFSQFSASYFTSTIVALNNILVFLSVHFSALVVICLFPFCPYFFHICATFLSLTPILSISSDHNLNLINILAQFFPGPISWTLLLQLLCFFHWFYSKHLYLLSKLLLHPFQCIWDIINLILLETSGAFMTCSPLDGFISTHLHSCHLGIAFPSLPFVSVSCWISCTLYCASSSFLALLTHFEGTYPQLLAWKMQRRLMFREHACLKMP